LKIQFNIQAQWIKRNNAPGSAFSLELPHGLPFGWEFWGEVTSELVSRLVLDPEKYPPAFGFILSKNDEFDDDVDGEVADDVKEGGRLDDNEETVSLDWL
jgi:hypothetical protein